MPNSITRHVELETLTKYRLANTEEQRACEHDLLYDLNATTKYSNAHSNATTMYIFAFAFECAHTTKHSHSHLKKCTHSHSHLNAIVRIRLQPYG